ncbi:MULTISPECIES: hypothetical protein [Paenibacillus]|uniref:Uncharacterized protein n=1 Tax=Paenibacillus lignilyticus TaxID=1172615 RepID=A0ABS5CBB4_9BACL|nr:MULTISPECIES: hypothetical protein [Paenibacillus]MBP3963284.1 hypothetical protein [Paenibacillus lignilyticus]SFS62421.1 hypothetical protein SAMN05428962_1698 [Paenibacillus sp. BC26]
MTVHYLLNCYNNQILVKQVEGDEGPFNVNIQCNNNPLSFGNTLYSAQTKEHAIRIANQLCAFYSMARVNGYYLDGKWFRNENKSDISAEHVLRQERTKDEMHAMLTSE